jgi:hypothetical protein
MTSLRRVTAADLRARLPGAQRSKNWTCGLPSLGAVGATLALMLLRPLRQGLAVV